jgi:hypothetical protein
MADLRIESEGIFDIKRVPGGTYTNVKLYAHSSGSIHALEDLTVKTLDLSIKNSSQINSNDLEVQTACKAQVEISSTCGPYMVLAGPLSGSVSQTSTLNTWIHRAIQKQSIDISVDSSSVFTHRDWDGPG